MVQEISASFATRRDADMAVEHLVQEYGLAADAVSVAAASEANSSGTAPSGGDLADARAPAKLSTEPQLAGRLVVSAKVDESIIDKVQSSFVAYGGERWAS